MIEKIVQDALVIWATIDPIGTMALFSVLTAHLSPQDRRKTAFKAVAYATCVLLTSIIVGQILLGAMGIRLMSFQLAGGIILFLFGLQMIFGSDVTPSEHDEGHDIAVFPLAIPTTATPGAILAVILLTDNNVNTIPMQVGTTIVVLVVLGITLGLMLISDRILKVIGKSGASILVRVMGMILTALSVEMVMKALGVHKWTQEDSTCIQHFIEKLV